jgi:hypothetical protein
MDMNGRTKFLIIGLLPVLALIFFLSHFWSQTVCALGKVVAAGAVLLVLFSKLLAGINAVHFLL